MSSCEIVLASSSPYRRMLLERLGLQFLQDSPDVDEEAMKDSGQTPAQIASALARAKAKEVARRHPGRLVIGSDQVVDLRGQVLGKTAGPAECQRQLSALAGHSHRLLTAVCLVAPSGEAQDHLDVHEMQMRALNPGEIERYVREEEPWDCAGGYKIESLGISLFDRIVGEDFTAITGLPLMALGGMLRAAGHPLP